MGYQVPHAHVSLPQPFWQQKAVMPLLGLQQPDTYCTQPHNQMKGERDLPLILPSCLVSGDSAENTGEGFKLAEITGRLPEGWRW